MLAALAGAEPALATQAGLPAQPAVPWLSWDETARGLEMSFGTDSDWGLPIGCCCCKKMSALLLLVWKTNAEPTSPTLSYLQIPVPGFVFCFWLLLCVFFSLIILITASWMFSSMDYLFQFLCRTSCKAHAASMLRPPDCSQESISTTGNQNQNYFLFPYEASCPFPLRSQGTNRESYIITCYWESQKLN